MDTYLPPIEQPQGLVMKLVYWMSRRRFGKVMTPLKVISARMPLAFGSWVGKVSQLDRKLTISEELNVLIRQQVARINVCEFCIDMSRWFAMQKTHAIDKVDALDHYDASPLFSEAERATLEFVTRLTRDKKVSPDLFHRVAGHFTDRQMCEIAWIVASEHVYNLSNIALNIHSDGFCRLEPPQPVTAAA